MAVARELSPGRRKSGPTQATPAAVKGELQKLGIASVTARSIRSGAVTQVWYASANASEGPQRSVENERRRNVIGAIRLPGKGEA